jgi:hypothetical protein
MSNKNTIGLAIVAMFGFVMAVLLVGEAAQKKMDLINQENVVVSYGR